MNLQRKRFRIQDDTHPISFYFLYIPLSHDTYLQIYYTYFHPWMNKVILILKHMEMG